MSERQPVQPDGKPTQKKPPAKAVLLAIAAALVVLLAFIMEARRSSAPANDGGYVSGQPRAEHAPPVGRSVIQDKLDELDWVRPEYLPINEFSRPGRILGEINGVVIHFIGNPNTTAMQNRNFFANLATTRERHASSNFIICLDGTVIQCVPVDEIAYASNIRNSDTLSIELCHPDESGRFNDETYESAVRLTAWLCMQYGLGPDDIIRHYDVTGKICPKYFVEDEDAWETFKADVAEAMIR